MRLLTALLSFAMIISFGMSESFGDDMPTSDFREQSIMINPIQESNAGVFIDDSTGITVVDLGTVFTIVGHGTIPDYMVFDGRTVPKEFISPVSLNGDWEYMQEHLVATGYHAVQVFTIDLYTDDQITYSFDFEVRQVSNSQITSNNDKSDTPSNYEKMYNLRLDIVYVFPESVETLVQRGYIIEAVGLDLDSRSSVLLDCGNTDSYPDVCVGMHYPDIDCIEIVLRDFVVFQPDPYGFDLNKDGIGCESKYYD